MKLSMLNYAFVLVVILVVGCKPDNSTNSATNPNKIEKINKKQQAKNVKKNIYPQLRRKLDISNKQIAELKKIDREYKKASKALWKKVGKEKFRAENAKLRKAKNAKKRKLLGVPLFKECVKIAGY